MRRDRQADLARSLRQTPSGCQRWVPWLPPASSTQRTFPAPCL